MKYLFLMTAVLLSLAANTSSARMTRPDPAHAVGNGMPPHPGLDTMSLVAPEAGVDYPTDTRPPQAQILVLLLKRIRIDSLEATLVRPVAGEDYPTDSAPPVWSRFQKVLVLGQAMRIPVRLLNAGETWLLPNGTEVDVRSILSIEHGQAGVDYPTDAPMVSDTWVMVLENGQRIPL